MLNVVLPRHSVAHSWDFHGTRGQVGMPGSVTRLPNTRGGHCSHLLRSNMGCIHTFLTCVHFGPFSCAASTARTAKGWITKLDRRTLYNEVRAPINFYLLTPSGSFCGARTSLIVIQPLVWHMSELLAQ